LLYQSLFKLSFLFGAAGGKEGCKVVCVNTTKYIAIEKDAGTDYFMGCGHALWVFQTWIKV
jgi:hypothetical protein